MGKPTGNRRTMSLSPAQVADYFSANHLEERISEALYDAVSNKALNPLDHIANYLLDLKSKMRRPIVGGNWKCNLTMAGVDALLDKTLAACDTSGCDVVVAPISLHLSKVVSKIGGGVQVAAQNCNFKGCGAFTGEMSAEQLLDLGVGWVVLGHSERRDIFLEDDDLLEKKLAYALSKGLNV